MYKPRLTDPESDVLTSIKQSTTTLVTRSKYHYLGVLGATGFRVDLKTMNPVKIENSTQAVSMRQNLSLILK